MEENKPGLVLHAQESQSQMSVFSNTVLFEQAQRFATALCKSDIVPKAYQNNIPNTLVALEMANRMGESPLMIMQNLDVIHGRPSFNSKFIIARLNTCGRFSPLRFKYIGEGDKRSCHAYCLDAVTKEALEGPPCSVEMAKKEGWWGKTGSKWPTMTDLMLMYRAGTFFGRMYAPELSMGMQTTEEMVDIGQAPMVEAKHTEEAILDLNTAAKVEKGKGTGRRVNSPAVEVPLQPVKEEQPVSSPAANSDEEMI